MCSLEVAQVYVLENSQQFEAANDINACAENIIKESRFSLKPRRRKSA